MLAELLKVEWEGRAEVYFEEADAPDLFDACPSCGGIKPRGNPYPKRVVAEGVGHRPDCTLASVIRKASGT